MIRSQQSSFYETQQGRIHLRQWGSGNRLFIALHGFGETGASFAPLAEVLPSNCMLIAPDLPFHGQTEWRASTFSAISINRLVVHLLENTGSATCSLLGHSMGGRLALSCVKAQKAQIETLYLLAPDGIDSPYRFWQDQIPGWGRSSLEWLASNPVWITRLATTMRKVGVLDRFALKYVQRHLTDDQRRSRLFGTWRSLVDFRWEKESLNELFKGTNIPIQIYLGKWDRLNAGDWSQQLAKQLPHVDVHLLEAGHDLIGIAAPQIVATVSP